MRLKKSLEERLWEKVDIRGEDECWPWQGCAYENGAGILRVDDRHNASVTRVVWSLTHGSSPSSRYIMQTCENPACCNPKHLIEAISNRTNNVEERFWNNVAIAGEDECWVWQGGKGVHGYGVFCFNGKARGAHRVALQLSSGNDIPSDLLVCHRCDNPPCCNPKHLFLGTYLDNNRDRVQKGRSSKLRGSDLWMAKLTPEIVREIRSKKHLSDQELSNEYGVSRPTIWAVKSGKTWKHVV